MIGIKRPERGFTLIEVLTVIVVISILMGVVYSSFSTSRENARNKALFTTLKQIQLGFELYKAQNGVYPMPTSADCGSLSSGGDKTVVMERKTTSQGPFANTNCGNLYLGSDVVPEYIDAVPLAEDSNNPLCKFTYYFSNDGSSYKLTAELCLEGVDSAAEGIQPGDEFARYPAGCTSIVSTSEEYDDPFFYQSPAVYGGPRYCIEFSDSGFSY